MFPQVRAPEQRQGRLLARSQARHLTSVPMVSKRITVTITDDQYVTLLREVARLRDELVVTNRQSLEQVRWVTPSVVVRAALDALGDAPSSGREIRSRLDKTGWGGHREGAGRRARRSEPGTS